MSRLISNPRQTCLPLVLAAVIALAAPVAAAQQVDLGAAAQYSGFFFGNLSKVPDVEGRLAVGGNLSLGGFSIGARVPINSVQPSLVVGGDLTSISGGAIHAGIGHNGYGVYSGAKAPGIPAHLDFRRQTPGPVDFEAERTYLTILSQQLRDAAPTGSVAKLYSSITLTGSNQDIEVFNLKPEHVVGGLDLHLENVKPDAHVIINVAADAQRKVKIGITMAALESRHGRVLFNLPDADVLNFTGVWVWASVLAPYACVKDSNGHLEGTIIAASWDATMKIGYGPFEASK